MSHAVPEEQWTRAGLSVLGHDENNSVILFSSDSIFQSTNEPEIENSFQREMSLKLDFDSNAG